MTEAMARKLVAMFGHCYVARKLHGQWVVWCDESDHVVEFDADTLAQARAAVNADADTFEQRAYEHHIVRGRWFREC